MLRATTQENGSLTHQRKQCHLSPYLTLLTCEYLHDRSYVTKTRALLLNIEDARQIPQFVQGVLCLKGPAVLVDLKVEICNSKSFRGFFNAEKKLIHKELT